MKAWMRFLLLAFLVFGFSFSQTSVFADEISPELQATFAPGADGKSVNLSTSIRIPTSGVGNVGSNSANRVGPLIWRWQIIPVPAESVLANGCDPNTQAPPNTDAKLGPQSSTGALTYGFYVDRNSGQISNQTYYCRETGSSLIPNFIPQAPTYSQIWNAIYSQAFNDQSISSGAYIAPKSPGLTGLPTNIWIQFPSGQTISRDVTINGFRIIAQAKVTEVSILSRSPKGLQIQVARLTPSSSGFIDGGSFEKPAAITKFRSVGRYIITTGVIWTADNATLSGPGIATISVPLGSIRIEINREYDVQELIPAITK